MHADDHLLDLEHPPVNMDPRFWNHARFPQHTQALASIDGEAVAVGSCGDAIRIRLAIENDRIVGIQQIPDGCVYTVACASAVTTLVQGMSLEDAQDVQPEQVSNELGGLPEDHLHCARLAVNTVGEAIADHYGRRQQAISSLETAPAGHPLGTGEH